MDSRPHAPPYPTGTEYAKPPPYYAPETHGAPNSSGFAGGNFTNTQPTTSSANAAWVGPAPPPPYHSRVETEHFQGTRNPNPTVIAVTTTQPTTYITTEPHQTVLVLGNCPSCRVGFLQNEFNIIGIVLALIFFPIGILCCLCMMDKRCSHCGARF